MAKYASKGEPRSLAPSSAFQACVEHLGDESNTHTAFRSAMVKSLGKRDFSAQETAHLLLSLPLVSCTFSFVALSLNGGQSLARNHSGEHILQPSTLDYYASHSTHQDMNLINFVSAYTFNHGELQKRSSEVIVRTFPCYPSNPYGEQYGWYCKYQLLKYKPWIGSPLIAWGDLPDTDSNCIEAYRDFLCSPTAATYCP